MDRIVVLQSLPKQRYDINALNSSRSSVLAEFDDYNEFLRCFPQYESAEEVFPARDGNRSNNNPNDIVPSAAMAGVHDVLTKQGVIHQDDRPKHAGVKTLMQDEDRETGGVSSRIYGVYFSSMSSSNTVMVALCLGGAYALST